MRVCIKNMVEAFSTTCGTLTNNDKIPNLDFLKSLYPGDYRHMFYFVQKKLVSKLQPETLKILGKKIARKMGKVHGAHLRIISHSTLF